MVINSIPSGLCLSGNLPKLSFSAGGDVRIRLLDGDQTILDETYAPDFSGNITLDLSELVRDALYFTMPDDDVFVQPAIAKTFTISLNDELHQFKAIRAGVKNMSGATEIFLKQHFFTAQEQIKEVTFDQPEWLTCYAAQDCYLYITAYSRQQIEHIQLATLMQGKVYTVNMQFKRLAALCQHLPEIIAAYSVDSPSPYGKRQNHKQYYKILTRESAYSAFFGFENSRGGFDTACCTGEAKTTPEYAPSTAMIDDAELAYRIDKKDIRTQNTGWLSKEAAIWLQDMFASRKIYRFDNEAGQWQHVILNENPIAETSNRKGETAFEFTYRPAVDKPYLSIRRTKQTLSATWSDFVNILDGYDIILDTYSFDASSGGGNDLLTVISLGGGWLVQSKPAWITVAPGSGAEGSTLVTVTIAANALTSQRTGNIVFAHEKDGSESETVVITQEAAPPPAIITLSINTINMAYGGGNDSVMVTSVGGGWLVDSKPAWVTVAPGSGAEGSTLVTVTIAANSIADERDDTVIFRHATDSTKTASLTVTQDAAPVAPNEITINATWPEIGGDTTVSVSAQFPVSSSIVVLVRGEASYDGGVTWEDDAVSGYAEFNLTIPAGQTSSDSVDIPDPSGYNKRRFTILSITPDEDSVYDYTAGGQLIIAQPPPPPPPPPPPVEYLFRMYFTGEQKVGGYNVTNCEVELVNKATNERVLANGTIGCRVEPTNGRMNVDLPSGYSFYNYSDLQGDLDPNHQYWGVDIEPGGEYQQGSFYWELYWMGTLANSGNS
jgi:hypothetical protein